MSLSRSLGNRKLNFALINRRRLTPVLQRVASPLQTVCLPIYSRGQLRKTGFSALCMYKHTGVAHCLERLSGHRTSSFIRINRNKKGKKMTTQSEDAINTVLQNFLLDAEQPMEQVTGALSIIGADKSFEALGKAVYAAMLNTHTARLQSAKATLTAQAPKKDIH